MSADKKGSIIELLIYLWQEADEQHPVTNEDINAYMEKCGYCLDRKTIPSHIATLNDCLEKTGVEVAMVKQDRRNAYYLVGKSFEIEQITEIILAVIQSKSVSRRNSQEFIEKLFSQLSTYEEKQVKDSLSSTTSIIRRSNMVSYTIGEILKAINQGRKIAFKYIKDMYSKDNSNIEERVVSPFCLTCNDNAMYLVGYYPKHNSDSSFFRLDRIENIKILDEPADLSTKKISMENRSEYNKKMTFGEPITVILEFKSEVSTVIYDRYGDIKPLKTEFGYKISESDILCDELLGWLFIIGKHIKILGCEKLKTAFKQRLKEISEGDIFN